MSYFGIFGFFSVFDKKGGLFDLFRGSGLTDPKKAQKDPFLVSLQLAKTPTPAPLVVLVGWSYSKLKQMNEKNIL